MAKRVKYYIQYEILLTVTSQTRHWFLLKPFVPEYTQVTPPKASKMLKGGRRVLTCAVTQ